MIQKMQLQDIMPRDVPIVPSMRPTDNGKTCPKERNPTNRIAHPHHNNHLSEGSESFRELEMGVPIIGDSNYEKKLGWLRSQIIGDDVEFESPFGTRRLTYADYTASGRSLHYIENFIVKHVLPFYGNSHTTDSYVGLRTSKMVSEASQYIKSCLGGGQDDAILFCGSGTTGAIKRLQDVMGISIAPTMRDRVLKCLKPEERWIVFVGPYEHHSNLLSWRQSIAEVVEICLNDGLIDTDYLRQKLESFKNANRPILGSFSACSNVTGIYTDTRKIARLLHEYGGFACFDFAASGPYQDINIKSGEIDGYDAVFLSPHKFLGGPGSPGILLMNKSLYQLKYSPPSTCGGGTVNYVNGFNEMDTLYVDDIEERENAGTPQIVQIIRGALAFWVKECIGYQVILKQEEIYIENALERLVKNKHVFVLGNTTVKRQAIVSFLVHSTSYSSDAGMTNSRTNKKQDLNDREHLLLCAETGNKRGKPLHGPFVAVLLNDLFGIQARGGCACAGPYGHILLGLEQDQSLAIRSAIEKGLIGLKPGWTRISFPYYMSVEEFEFTLAAVEFIAIYGQRFLPLYQPNLRTGTWTFKRMSLQDLMGQDKSTTNSSIALSFLDALQTISLQHTKVESKNTEAKHNEFVERFTSYLEVAKQIASKLPKFPSPGKLSEDIDPNLLQFRL